MEHPCAQGLLFQKLIYLNHLSSLEDYNGVKSAREMSKEMMGLQTVFPSFIFKKVSTTNMKKNTAILNSISEKGRQRRTKINSELAWLLRWEVLSSASSQACSFGSYSRERQRWHSHWVFSTEWQREGGAEYFFFHRCIPEYLAASQTLWQRKWQQRGRPAQLINRPSGQLSPLLVLRTSKRLSHTRCIRWPSQDFGFAKHSPKSKLLLKTGDKFTVFLNSQWHVAVIIWDI